MSSEAELVAVGYAGWYGPGKRTWSEWGKMRAVFLDFAGMDERLGHSIDSSVMVCNGSAWKVRVCPSAGGHRAPNIAGTEYVSVFLDSVSATTDNPIAAEYVIRVPSADYPTMLDGTTTRKHTFESTGENGWENGYRKYATRADVLDPSKQFLVDGNLTIEVDLRVVMDKPPELPAWSPSNTVCTDMLKMLEAADDDNADAVFRVGRKTGANKTEEVELLYAHRLILETRAPELAALVEECPEKTPIPMDDVDHDLFRVLLRFVYGGEIPQQEFLKDNIHALISAADRFGCSGLKLAAEAELAAAGINVDNAAELILFADGTTCALLKEAAVDFFVSNSEAVMASDGYAKVKESPDIMHELMAAMSCSGRRKRAGPSGPSRYYGVETKKDEGVSAAPKARRNRPRC